MRDYHLDEHRDHDGGSRGYSERILAVGSEKRNSKQPVELLVLNQCVEFIEGKKRKNYSSELKNFLQKRK